MTKPRRNAEATREKILKAGIKDFCAHGYNGARIDKIAKLANCNIRMIYHYFGNKEGLYLAALERVYGVMRQREAELDLRELPPVEAIQKLVVFAFDHMAENKDFVKLVIAENLQRGRFLKKSKTVSKASTDLLKMISEVLENGAKQGVFRPDVDALQLYVSIISLGFTHLSNQHTLSITYQEDLAAKDWLAARREHVLQMVLDYLRP